MKLSVIIPAYNEADRIVPTLENTLGYLDSRSYSSEVLVVSDGSTDDTEAVVRDFSRTSATRVRALAYRPNRGKGYAVRYGMRRGSGDCLLFMDADYSVPIESVETAMAILDSGKDIAIASRAIAGAVIRRRQNLPREFSAWLYTLVQRLYLGISYKDTQCGFKIFTKSAAEVLFSRQRLHSVIFDPEILWLAKKMGFDVGEFPVQWTHIENSRIQYDSLRKSLFVFQELYRIKRLHPEI